MEGLLVLCDLRSICCSMRLDMISPHFAQYLRALAKLFLHGFEYLRIQSDQGTVILHVNITANLWITTNARLSTLVMLSIQRLFWRQIVYKCLVSGISC